MRGYVRNNSQSRERRSIAESQLSKSEKRSKCHLSSKMKNAHIFQLYYADLCSIQNFPMLYGVKAHLHKRILDFNGDRVKLDEWRPILKALSVDRSLHFIAVRSRHSNIRILEHIDTESRARSVVKQPVLITRFVLKRLADSLSHCLAHNSHLTCIELDGLILTGEYLDIFATGLRKSVSLQHLSLHRCPIGDKGCHVVCSCLRNLPSVVSLDLSGCDLSAAGAHSISKTLQYQNLNRYGENWKQSLRYRTPNTDMMPGLRRVTLNHNPQIGDVGVQELLDVIRDDLWLKALDLQNVGITSDSGTQVLELLHVNNCLAIIDVRNNLGIGTDLLREIMCQLACNNVDKIPEYHWLPDDAACLPRRPSYLNCNMMVGKKSSRLRLPSWGRSTEIPSARRGEPGSVTVHVTKSNILPAGNPPVLQLRKTASACAASMAAAIPSRIASRLKRRRELRAQVTAGVPNIFNFQAVTPAHSSGGPEVVSPTFGDHYKDPVDLLQAKKRLLELSAHLEEEIQKRQAAERQKDDLQAKLNCHLQELNDIQRAMIGRVLVDKKFIEVANSTVTDFYRFLAIVKNLGLSDVKSSDLTSSLKSSLSGSNTSLACSQSEQCDSVQLTNETNELMSGSNLSSLRNSFKEERMQHNVSVMGASKGVCSHANDDLQSRRIPFSTPPEMAFSPHSRIDTKQLILKLDQISKDQKSHPHADKDLNSLQLSEKPTSVMKDEKRSTNNLSLSAIKTKFELKEWLFENDISHLSSRQRDMIKEQLSSPRNSKDLSLHVFGDKNDKSGCESGTNLQKPKEEAQDSVVSGRNGSAGSNPSWSTLMSPDSNSDYSF